MFSPSTVTETLLTWFCVCKAIEVKAGVISSVSDCHYQISISLNALRRAAHSASQRNKRRGVPLSRRSWPVLPTRESAWAGVSHDSSFLGSPAVSWNKWIAASRLNDSILKSALWCHYFGRLRSIKFHHLGQFIFSRRWLFIRRFASIKRLVSQLHFKNGLWRLDCDPNYFLMRWPNAVSIQEFCTTHHGRYAFGLVWYLLVLYINTKNKCYRLCPIPIFFLYIWLYWIYIHTLLIGSFVLFQRVERESTKSPATTGSRKKAAVKSNGQITTTEPPQQPPGQLLCVYQRIKL